MRKRIRLRDALMSSVVDVARGRHRLIGSQVSDAIRCRDDIAAVQL
jgi:hypothetical protein